MLLSAALDTVSSMVIEKTTFLGNSANGLPDARLAFDCIFNLSLSIYEPYLTLPLPSHLYRYGGVGGAIYLQGQVLDMYLANFTGNMAGSVESVNNLFPQYSSAGS